MKKLSFLALGLALLIGLYGFWGNDVHAVDQISNAMFEESLDNATEYSDVKNLFEKDFQTVKKLIESDKSFVPQKYRGEVVVLSDMGIPYKVYYAPNDFLEGFIKGDKFDRALLGQHFWEVPLLDAKGRVINTSTAWKDQGKWQIAQTGLYAPVEVIELINNPDHLGKLLADNDITEFKKIKHVRILMAGIDVLYVVSKDNQEYLLPFGNRPELAGLENLKVYAVDEVRDIWQGLSK